MISANSKVNSFRLSLLFLIGGFFLFISLFCLHVFLLEKYSNFSMGGEIVTPSISTLSKYVAKKYLIAPLLKNYFVLSKQDRKNFLNSQNLLSEIRESNIGQLVLLIKIYKPNELLDKLAQETEFTDGANCNWEAYRLGVLSYKVVQEQSIKTFISTCSSGYMHGAIGTYIWHKNIRNVSDYSYDVCSQYKKSFEVMGCYHAAGNGYMAITDNNVPLSLRYCARNSSVSKRRSCYKGVFEENINSSLVSSINQMHTQWIKKNLQYPCNIFIQHLDEASVCYETHMPQRVLNTVESKISFRIISVCIMTTPIKDIGSCFEKYKPITINASQYLSVNNEAGIRRLISQCLLIGDDKYVNKCFYGFGIEAKKSVSLNEAKAREICNALPSEYREFCISGVVNQI